MRKPISMLMTAIMAASMLPQSILAEETVTLTKSQAKGAPAIITAQSSMEGELEYVWVTRSSKSGAYSELPKETKDKYIVSTKDKNMYLNCKVTKVAADGTKSEPVLAGEDIQITSLGQYNRTTAKDSDSAAANYLSTPAATPAEYKFRVNGQGREYILLDELNDTDSAFYILTDFSFGQSVFDTTEGHVKFEPACPTNVGNKINSDDFKTNGLNNEKLNSEVKKHIDWNHVWWTERGFGSQVPDDYSFTAGMSLLSITEAYKYAGKYGYDYSKGAWWWLRTQRGNGGSNNNMMAMKPGTKEFWGFNANAPIQDGAGYVTPYVRPTFYLDEDFFREVKLTVFDSDNNVVIGSDVCDTIVNRYDRAELEGLYTDEELAQIGYDAPSYANITTTHTDGNPYILAAEYTDENAVSYEYQWITRAETNGAYKELPTDKADKYIVTPRDKNMYLNCYITPVYSDGTKGESVKCKEDVQITKLGRYNRTNAKDSGAANYLSTPADTPSEYKFKIKGQNREYILLDELNDVNSAFYILTEAAFGQSVFDTEEGNAKFNPESDTNIGHKINSEEFKSSGLNGVTLNDGIKSHINWNHVWWTEQGMNSQIPEDYSFTAGMSLLSISEAYKYAGKYGYNLNSNNSFWWTRSQRGANGVDDNILRMKPSTKEFWNAKASNPEEMIPYVRPTFYLNEDFFRDVTLTILDDNGNKVIGDEVCKTILNRYSKEELSGLYNEKELNAIGYPSAISMEEQTWNIYTRSELKAKINYVPTGMSEIKISYGNGAVTETVYEDISWDETPIELEFVMDKIPNGTNDITISIVKDGDVDAEYTQRAYVVPDAKDGTDVQRFGMNLHIGDLEKYPEYIDIAHKLGFRDLRIGWTWGRAEKEQGVYNFEGYDKIMERAESLGMNVLHMLLFNNAKYSSTTSDKEAIDTAEERAAFVNYAKAYVKHYPNIEKLEIWNEPNHPGFWDNGTGAIGEEDAKNYAMLVKEVSAAVKEINPDIAVYAGSIDVSKKPIEYIQNMFKYGVYDYLDTLSYHPYFHPKDVTASDEEFFVENRINNYKKALLAQGGFKSLAATEFGFSTAYGTLEAQTREVPKAFVEMLANQINKGQMFNLIDTKEKFGLFDSNKEAKDLLYSTAQMNSALYGARFIGKLPSETGINEYVFVKNDKPMIIAWADAEIALNVPGAAVEFYDMNGNAIEAVNNTVTISKNIVYAMNADEVVYAAANQNSTAVKKAEMKAYFNNLPTEVEAAIDNNDNNLKTVIMNSSMSDLDKSALLNMVYELESLNAAYNSIGKTAVPVDTSRYESLKSEAANNSYAKAALKYAQEYIAENDRIKAFRDTGSAIYANNEIINALLDTVSVMLNKTESELKVINVEKKDGVLTFAIDNPIGEDLDIFVAAYENGALKSVNTLTEDSLSCNVGTASGKILVWKANTMIPLTKAVDF